MVSPTLLLSLASLAAAHFQLEYPEWRADSLKNTSYSQYEYPCAGVPVGAPKSNRSEWDISGGSLRLHLHHPWTYVFVNLGVGENVTNFNYTLTPSLWNATGNGTLCIPHMALPADLKPVEGQKATIQVVTSGDSGSALYNCADITFKTNVTAFGGATCDTQNVNLHVIGDQTDNKTESSSSSTGTAASGTSSSSAAAATTSSGSSSAANPSVGRASMAATLVSAGALAMAFVCGMAM